jgi:bifunctional non-homologous end joining protein LigD
MRRSAASRQGRRRNLVLERTSGAVSSPYPGFIEPCLATQRDSVPERGIWLHEIKHDGYRAQAHLVNGKAAIYTRRGYDWSDRFASIARALPELGRHDFILDGEVVVPDERGISNFHSLQDDLARKRQERLVYFVFDVLYLDGFDLREVALIERKRILAELIGSAEDLARIRFSDHIEADAEAVFKQACDLQIEGIVSKEQQSPYRSGRQESWIKVKCVQTGTFPIIAFVEKLGASPRRIASLYLGRWEGGKLLYAGKAQTGFKQEMLYDLRERLDPYVRDSSPLSVPIRKPKATWVEPVLQAEIAYSSLTADERLRAPVYRGIRDDLLEAPAQQRLEATKQRGEASGQRWEGATHRRESTHQRRESTNQGRESTSQGRESINQRRESTGNAQPRVPKENILQLLTNAVVPSKAELARYWSQVAPEALQYIARRPLKLVRHTRGTTFYHKGPLPPIPASVHELHIEKREGGKGTRLWVDDLPGLLGLVEIGAVELHAWNCTVDDIEHPDVMVFDLDPGPGVSWSLVRDTAFDLRELLKKEGLASWPKLTGGKGVHVMVPLTGHRMTHDEVHQYSRTLAAGIAARQPDRYTTSAVMAERDGRLFIDYLRNGRGTTAVATYSPRVRAGFPIAAPTTWEALKRGIRPDAYSMKGPLPQVPRRKTRASRVRNPAKVPELRTREPEGATHERRQKPARVSRQQTHRHSRSQ